MTSDGLRTLCHPASARTLSSTALPATLLSQGPTEAPCRAVPPGWLPARPRGLSAGRTWQRAASKAMAGRSLRTIAATLAGIASPQPSASTLVQLTAPLALQAGSSTGGLATALGALAGFWPDSTARQMLRRHCSAARARSRAKIASSTTTSHAQPRKGRAHSTTWTASISKGRPRGFPDVERPAEWPASQLTALTARRFCWQLVVKLCTPRLPDAVQLPLNTPSQRLCVGGGGGQFSWLASFWRWLCRRGRLHGPKT